MPNRTTGAAGAQQAAFEQALESAAVAAWNALMDYCQKRGLPPGDHNDLFAVVGAIRTLKHAHIHTSTDTQTDLPPLPTRMPASLLQHPTLGDLYDRLAVHQYAVGYAQATLRLHGLFGLTRKPPIESAAEGSLSVERSPYTVIAVDEESGQIVSHFVTAENGLNAFHHAAKEMADHGESDLCMVAALDGHVSEFQGITFPGEGMVDAHTVLEQDDVFSPPTTTPQTKDRP